MRSERGSEETRRDERGDDGDDESLSVPGTFRSKYLGSTRREVGTTARG